jgi:hypothetical protein
MVLKRELSTHGHVSSILGLFQRALSRAIGHASSQNQDQNHKTERQWKAEGEVFTHHGFEA